MMSNQGYILVNAKNAQKIELEFWENLQKNGREVELKYARDLPECTPDFILDMIAEFEHKAAEFCFQGAQGRILDAGCGNGNLLTRTLKQNSGNITYVGLDFSRNMLRRAATRAKTLDYATFLRGCISNLPFEDESFDRVISSGVITCLPSYKDARDSLKEFYRLLRPVGILAVDFFNQGSHFAWFRRHILRERLEPPEFISYSEFKADLERVGFKIMDYLGFDYKPFQGYLFQSRMRPIIDPFFVQERFTRLVEARLIPKMPILSLCGYRIYVKCVKNRLR
ncbi:MAG: class I SAM-dependent methyltransferase [Methanotrichaceae archaeon]|nr:class I SAM-dependent methyltransferase [Methanotrichaceae archaeon]